MKGPATQVLQAPHYSSTQVDYGKREATIWGAAEDGLFYNYDDRLPNLGQEAMERSADKADESGAAKGTAKWWEVRLSDLYGHAVELRHVVAGANASSWHPFLIFGTRRVEP